MTGQESLLDAPPRKELVMYEHPLDFSCEDMDDRCGDLELALAEAERVLRVISGWNTDLVSTADAIQPAVAYFAAKAVPRG
jgi:hypothetical protein